MSKSDYGKPARVGYSREYEEAWLNLFGVTCPDCKGTGQVGEEIVKWGRSMGFRECPKCKGEGKIEKGK